MSANSSATAVAMLLGSLLLIGCTGAAWEPIKLSTHACIERAKLVLRDTDFNQNRTVVVDRGGGTVTADHASYRAQLRCTAGSVDFIVTGPDRFQVDWYRDDIVRKFQ